MEKILSFYEKSLSSLGVYFENDMGYTIHREERIPATIDGRRLVMPTREILNGAKWDTQFPFHPLSESLVRGESECLQYIRERILRKLGATIGILLYEITSLAVDASRHPQLTPEQLSVLSELGKVDDRTATDIDKLVTACAKKGNGTFVNIYLRRDGHSHGTSYRRLAVTTFPVFEQLAEGTAMGVTLRVADKKFLKNVLEMIIPDIGERDQYSVGSNSDTGPYLEALLRAYAKVMDPLNSRVWLFRKHLGEMASLRSPTDWLAGWDDAMEQASLIPPLPGNIGKGGDEQNDNAVLGIAPTPNLTGGLQTGSSNLFQSLAAVNPMGTPQVSLASQFNAAVSPPVMPMGGGLLGQPAFGSPMMGGMMQQQPSFGGNDLFSAFPKAGVGGRPQIQVGFGLQPTGTISF